MIDTVVIGIGFLLSAGLIFYAWKIKRYTLRFSGRAALDSANDCAGANTSFVQVETERSAERIALETVKNSRALKVLLAGEDQFLVNELWDKHANIEYLQARTFTECIRVARDLNPDVILLDLAGSQTSGFEMLRRIRTELARLPVFILTHADSSMEDIEISGLHAGADDHVIKPHSVTELKAAISICLQKKRITP